MLEDFEKKLNKWLVDFVIGGSYMGDGGSKIIDNKKKMLIDIYQHLLLQYENFKKWYRN